MTILILVKTKQRNQETMDLKMKEEKPIETCP